MKIFFIFFMMINIAYAGFNTNEYIEMQQALSNDMTDAATPTVKQKKHEGYTLSDVYETKNSKIWREKGTNKLANGIVHNVNNDGYTEIFTIKKGKIEGDYRGYSATNGELYTISHYIHGIKNGKTTTFSCGNPNIVRTVVNYVNGMREGKEYYYYGKGGGISLIANYEHDKLEGIQKGFYDSGNLQELSMYHNGIMSSSTVFYETGEKMRTVKHFKSNHMQGETFYKNGNIKSKYSGYVQNIGNKKNINIKINTYYKNGHKEYQVFIKGEDDFTGYKFNNDKKIKMNYAQTYNYIRTKEWIKGEK